MPKMQSIVFMSMFSMLLAVGKEECIISVEKNLQNQSGFHRTMRFQISMDIADDIQEILLDYIVSSDIYIDYDEVSDLIRGKNNSYQLQISSHIDTEQPSYLSSNHNVVIKVLFYKSKVVIVEIPFHLRYQRPSIDHYQSVNIPLPAVKKSNSTHCITISDVIVTNVPRGVTYHTPFVVLVTILVSTFCWVALII